MSAREVIFRAFLLLLMLANSSCQEKVSKQNKEYIDQGYGVVFNDTDINIHIISCSNPSALLTVRWMVRHSPCVDEISQVESDDLASLWYNPMTRYSDEYDYVEFLISRPVTCHCDQCTKYMHREKGEVRPTVHRCPYGNATNTDDICAQYKNKLVETTKDEEKDSGTGKLSSAPLTDTKRAKRDASDAKSDVSDDKSDVSDDNKSDVSDDKSDASDVKSDASGSNSDGSDATSIPQPKQPTPYTEKTWKDGLVLVLLHVSSGDEVTFSSQIEFKGRHGYLSAVEWNYLVFYGIMCVVYVLYGLVWIVVSALQWRDLLRIQFWIGAVIILGMLEKAVFYAYFQHKNNFNEDVRGAHIFAELVSCLKRSLARMLVIIVSLGYGIVKPRLGQLLHKVVGMGFLYFILAAVESCLRIFGDKADRTNSQDLLARIPLAVVDMAICYWIFTSLMQTMRQLRLRRNLVKLTLYRHFTNTLIFAVIASVCFMIWSIKVYKVNSCLSDWQELWVDDAFWHILFALLLAVIMVLWRPTQNNQRYAFTPLLDPGDDDDDDDDDGINDERPNEAFGATKRPKSPGQKVSGYESNVKRSAEDDLKWVEENIPSSVADAVLPALDSDDEIVTTRMEMSKMQ